MGRALGPVGLGPWAHGPWAWVPGPMGRALGGHVFPTSVQKQPKWEHGPMGRFMFLFGLWVPGSIPLDPHRNSVHFAAVDAHNG